MCLINLHLQEHPNYKLIVIANRDEFYERPTAPANFWEDKPEILAGRDLLELGTWIGVTEQGRFAAVTNFHDQTQKPSINDKISRGKIVTSYLKDDISPQSYLETLHKNKDMYEGFNVILGNEEELFYYNNIEMEITKISAGTHGVSNDTLNSPWPKVTKGKQRLREYIMNQEVIGANMLFDILADNEQAEDSDIPETGLDIELERTLSPIFIKTPDYGTRSSTVIFIDNDNYLTFVERTYQHGHFVRDNRYSFRINHKK